jgi:hypothetical protein
MSMFPNSNVRPVELEYGTDERAVFNFFNTVYAWMAAGLGVTAIVAFLVSQSPDLMKALLMNRLIVVALLLGAWAIAVAAQRVALRVSAAAGTALFLTYAAVIGALISGIFIIYSIPTLLAAFGMTAGTFAVMSIYGYITKRDLTKMGSILIMCAVGLFFASIVNIFMANGQVLSWIITYGVLLVFVGLTAYNTQQLRTIATNSALDGNLASRYAVIGSIILYISFINMFMSILRIMGSRK